MTYAEAAEFIENITYHSSKNPPDLVRRWVDLLGSPDKGLRVIHVAGTNGKGSVCTYLASILRSAGYSTGVFVSPHLVDLKERMLCDGRQITDDEFVECCTEVRAVVDRYTEEEKLPHPSYFEFLYMMCLVWFAKIRPDLCVIEAGIGGMLDCTETVCSKELSIISRIGMDHTSILGNTLTEIAGHKAGIIREAVPCVYLSQPEEACCVMHERAQCLGAPEYPVYPELYGGSELKDGKLLFRFCSRDRGSLEALLTSGALYQKENAALAVTAAFALNDKGYPIGRSEIEKGLSNAFWEARMEEIRPGVYLDGANNSDGIRAFIESVHALTENKEGDDHLLFSAVGDKGYAEMARMLCESGLFRSIDTAPIGGFRSLRTEDLSACFGALDAGNAEIHDALADAVRSALKKKKSGDRVWITGSLYLAGEMKKFFSEESSC